MAHLSAEDRFALATLVKWASDPQFLAGRPVHRPAGGEPGGDVRPARAQPYVASIEMPLPTEEERLDFVQVQARGQASWPRCRDVPAPALAKMTAGLSRINLDRILTEATEREVADHPELLKEKKKEIIQAECHGLLEFIEPAHTLDSVAGHARAKEMLRQAAGGAEEGPDRGDADGLPHLAARWGPARRSWPPASPGTSACPA